MSAGLYQNGDVIITSSVNNRQKMISSKNFCAYEDHNPSFDLQEKAENCLLEQTDEVVYENISKFNKMTLSTSSSTSAVSADVSLMSVNIYAS